MILCNGSIFRSSVTIEMIEMHPRSVVFKSKLQPVMKSCHSGKRAPDFPYPSLSLFYFLRPSCPTSCIRTLAGVFLFLHGVLSPPTKSHPRRLHTEETLYRLKRITCRSLSRHIIFTRSQRTCLLVLFLLPSRNGSMDDPGKNFLLSSFVQMSLFESVKGVSRLVQPPYELN